jgi:hypothetical protein
LRRLNFLEDEPWDEVEDDRRVRWFGHPFGDKGVIARFELASDD